MPGLLRWVNLAESDKIRESVRATPTYPVCEVLASGLRVSRS